jgi:hypothetical protein
MCNYCGYEHGIIGDVVCPVKKRFPQTYTSKYISEFHTDTWPHYLALSYPVKKYKIKLTEVCSTGYFSRQEKNKFKHFLDEFNYKKHRDSVADSKTIIGDIEPEKIDFIR